MQLVRVIKAGVDVDGDGSADLSTSRIYYAGQSFGGIYGTILLGARAATPQPACRTSPGGSIIEIARLGPASGRWSGIALLTRTPSLLQRRRRTAGPHDVQREHPAAQPAAARRQRAGRVGDPGGARRTEWVQQAGNPVLAPSSASPLHGTGEPVIFQFAKGDQTVPNPTATAILRAGDCADRRDALPQRPGVRARTRPTPKNPHTFLTNIGVPAARRTRSQAQAQIATFFATDGATTIDPDGAGPIFETPTSMVPEDLGFIP